MFLVIPWWGLALVLAGVLAVSMILGAAAGYRFGRRDGLEESSWVRDLPPVPLPDECDCLPPLAPLDPADPIDRLILEARMFGP